MRSSMHPAWPGRAGTRQCSPSAPRPRFRSAVPQARPGPMAAASSACISRAPFEARPAHVSRRRRARWGMVLGPSGGPCRGRRDARELKAFEGMRVPVNVPPAFVGERFFRRAGGWRSRPTPVGSAGRPLAPCPKVNRRRCGPIHSGRSPAKHVFPFVAPEGLLRGAPTMFPPGPSFPPRPSVERRDHGPLPARPALARAIITRVPPPCSARRGRTSRTRGGASPALRESTTRRYRRRTRSAGCAIGDGARLCPVRRRPARRSRRPRRDRPGRDHVREDGQVARPAASGTSIGIRLQLAASPRRLRSRRSPRWPNSAWVRPSARTEASGAHRLPRRGRL